MLKNNLKKNSKKKGGKVLKLNRVHTSKLRAKNLMAFESLPRTIENITQ